MKRAARAALAGPVLAAVVGSANAVEPFPARERALDAPLHLPADAASLVTTKIGEETLSLPARAYVAHGSAGAKLVLVACNLLGGRYFAEALAPLEPLVARGALQVVMLDKYQPRAFESAAADCLELEPQAQWTAYVDYIRTEHTGAGTRGDGLLDAVTAATSSLIDHAALTDCVSAGLRRYEGFRARVGYPFTVFNPVVKPSFLCGEYGPKLYLSRRETARPEWLRVFAEIRPPGDFAGSKASTADFARKLAARLTTLAEDDGVLSAAPAR